MTTDGILLTTYFVVNKKIYVKGGFCNDCTTLL